MRDLNHEPFTTPYVGRDRRADADRDHPVLRDDWTPMRRVTDGRIAFVADDIRHRLAPICSHWSERDFESLVQQIARMKVRWMQLERAD